MFACRALLLLWMVCILLPSAPAWSLSTASQVCAGLYLSPPRLNEEAASALRRFYNERQCEPLWLSRPEFLTSLLSALRELPPVEGLPEDYVPWNLPSDLSHLEKLDPVERGALELRLSRAFLRLAQHLAGGRTRPTDELSPWRVAPPPSLYGLLESVDAGQAPADVLRRLDPPHPGYANLLTALSSLRAQVPAEPLPSVPGGYLLCEGDTSDRIVALRERLDAQWPPGELAPAAPRVLDPELAERLRAFQSSRGLVADGCLGVQTLRELNATAQDLLDRVAVNLDRWRWLPRQLGETHIWVDLPRYTLTLTHPDEPFLEMPIVIGREDRPSPILVAAIDAIKLNPEWIVPPRLVFEDKLPKFQKNPSLFWRQDFEIVTRDGRRVDPSTLNWSLLGPKNFPGQLRQRPGVHNALGQIKFESPNPFLVYLHDTSQPELFEKEQRAFSSGCIRLAQPVALASALLGPEMGEEGVRERLDHRQTERIELERPVPVYLTYFTVRADAAGRLEYFADLYGRDQRQLKGLFPEEPMIPRLPFE